MIVLFNKPFNVMSQFSGNPPNLADYIPIPGIYAAGRLDKDSEGLMVLTDDGKLQARISAPAAKLPKTYWVQVEGIPDRNALWKLRRGVVIQGKRTLPAKARIIDAPPVWEREPPIRFRKHIPTCWLEITLREGRNRQIRRMTAAVGYPTLRLIRYAIGPWAIDDLAPGEWREASAQL